MTDPKAAHAHSVEQIIDLLRPELPSHVIDRIGGYLAERDRSIEDAIDGTLRKTVSLAMPGDGVVYANTPPTYDLMTQLAVVIEKHNASSRFEIDLVLNGTFSATMWVSTGVRLTRLDAPAVTPIDVVLGGGAADAGHSALPLHSSTGPSYEAGVYRIQPLVAVQAGTSFTAFGTAWCSIRVTESLY